MFEARVEIATDRAEAENVRVAKFLAPLLPCALVCHVVGPIGREIDCECWSHSSSNQRIYSARWRSTRLNS